MREQNSMYLSSLLVEAPLTEPKLIEMMSKAPAQIVADALNFIAAHPALKSFRAVDKLLDFMFKDHYGISEAAKKDIVDKLFDSDARSPADLAKMIIKCDSVGGMLPFEHPSAGQQRRKLLGKLSRSITNTDVREAETRLFTSVAYQDEAEEAAKSRGGMSGGHDFSGQPPAKAGKPAATAASATPRPGGGSAMSSTAPNVAYEARTSQNKTHRLSEETKHKRKASTMEEKKKSAYRVIAEAIMFNKLKELKFPTDKINYRKLSVDEIKSAILEAFDKAKKACDVEADEPEGGWGNADLEREIEWVKKLGIKEIKDFFARK